MKIVIDDKIPYIKGVFEPFAEVLYKAGAETTRADVLDAEAIITRTRTACDESLLKGTKVKMIATATIGYDHIDTAYCEKAGIEWTNAPGCNSSSVAQYVMAALSYWSNEKGEDPRSKTLGIIGLGNVGSKVARLAKILGMQVLLNDPPRERAEGSGGFVDIQTIQNEADIISVHTPLITEGIDRTLHLVDKGFLKACKRGLLFINTARGEVMDTQAIKKALSSNILSDAIIDCWENEPDIDLELLGKAFIATPHIAGYSKDGKARGTSMSVQAISKKFKLGLDAWEPKNIEKPHNEVINLNVSGKSFLPILKEAILFTHSIWEESERLKSTPENFEEQRGNYPVRREFQAFTLKSTGDINIAQEALKKFGFKFQ